MGVTLHSHFLLPFVLPLGDDIHFLKARAVVRYCTSIAVDIDNLGRGHRYLSVGEFPIVEGWTTAA